MKRIRSSDDVEEVLQQGMYRSVTEVTYSSYEFLNLLKRGAELPSLPIVVTSSISITKEHRFDRLPFRLIVIGDLRIDHHPMEYLGDHITVDGTLEITFCENLRKVGDHLTVLNHVVIANNPALEELGSNWSIGNNLLLDSLESIKELICREWREVRELTITHLPKLVSYPLGLNVSSFISLSRLDSLTRFPERLEVLHSIYLSDLRECEKLPTTMIGRVHISVENSPKLEKFSVEFQTENLQLINLPKLEEISSRPMKIPILRLRILRALKTLPEGSQISNCCDISNCPLLEFPEEIWFANLGIWTGNDKLRLKARNYVSRDLKTWRGFEYLKNSPLKVYREIYVRNDDVAVNHCIEKQMELRAFARHSVSFELETFIHFLYANSLPKWCTKKIPYHLLKMVWKCIFPLKVT